VRQRRDAAAGIEVAAFAETADRALRSTAFGMASSLKAPTPWACSPALQARATGIQPHIPTSLSLLHFEVPAKTAK
jgi:hypothetical protein